jgi:hypothetical protein
MRRPLDGVVEIDIIGGPSLLDIPEFFMGAMHWASRVSVERPACLLCEHQWTSLKQESPAAFAFITPWQNGHRRRSIVGQWRSARNAPDFRTCGSGR